MQSVLTGRTVRSAWPFWVDREFKESTGGEIDIVEGVNNNAATQYTLHTANGCTLQTPMKASGQVLTTDCYAYANFNTGCGVKERRSGSFGPSFNKNGGGVFATLWTDEGIKMFFWSRKNVPKDVKAMKPNPATWGTPAAFFSTATCSASFFKPQTIVIVRDRPLGSIRCNLTGCKEHDFMRRLGWLAGWWARLALP